MQIEQYFIKFEYIKGIEQTLADPLIQLSILIVIYICNLNMKVRNMDTAFLNQYPMVVLQIPCQQLIQTLMKYVQYLPNWQ